MIISLAICYQTPICVLTFYPSRKAEEHYTKNYYILKLNIKNLDVQRAKRQKYAKILICYILDSHSTYLSIVNNWIINSSMPQVWNQLYTPI